ncbi:hypothetical protein [Kytococcus sedentarius]|uniref:hypothetical protein n=1 Tax=Kytococcus sedentarius TaxID=1276 RepID=UPI0035BC91D1
MAGVTSSRRTGASQAGEVEQPVPSSPAAQRLRRPRWTDARLLVGGALVLAATLTGATLLGQGEGPQHWVATGDLPTGHVLESGDLRPVDGTSPEGVYLTGDEPLADREGQVVLRPVAEGEFLAVGDLGGAERLDLRRVSLQVSPGSAATLSPGSVVDLWSTPGAVTGEKKRPTPRQVLAGAEVARVQDTGDRLAGSDQTVAVDFLVPTDEVESLLADTGAGAEVTAVPLAGAPAGAGDGS